MAKKQPHCAFTQEVLHQSIPHELLDESQAVGQAFGHRAHAEAAALGQETEPCTLWRMPSVEMCLVKS